VSKQSRSRKAQELRAAELIIWDEAVMVDRWAIAAVDRTLRDLCNTPDQPFGGKIVILSGDFRQILPVLPKEPDFVVVSRTIKSALFWPQVCSFKPKNIQQVTTLRLSVNMRAATATGTNKEEQMSWANYLLQLGDGLNMHDPICSTVLIRG